MPNENQALRFKTAAPFCLLLIVILLLQVIGTYIGKDFLAWDGVKGYWVLSRLVLPFILVLFWFYC